MSRAAGLAPGAAAAPHRGLPGRVVGLAALAGVAEAQAWIGVALAREPA